MRLPGAQTHPAELSFAVLVPTDHVVAAPVLLNGDMAFWAFLLTVHRAQLDRGSKPGLVPGLLGTVPLNHLLKLEGFP